jgi:2'-5' RNA ligase
LLTAFQRQLELSVQRFAEKPEAKEFTAHVTLARLEKLRNRELEKLTAAMTVSKAFGEWMATEVQLIKSLLTSSGVLHATLDTFKTKND